MKFDKRQSLSTELQFYSDDFYTNLACVIVYSGIRENDTAFLESAWCSNLLDFIGVKLTVPELLAGYLKRKERVQNGSR